MKSNRDTLLAFGLTFAVMISPSWAAQSADHSAGVAIYVQRCSMCHDHPREQIPPKAVLTSKPHDRIVQVLTSGVMQPMAAGLTTGQIDAVATYPASAAPAGIARLEVRAGREFV